MTVISNFFSIFMIICDGHLFDSSSFICLTIGNKLMSNCFYFFGKRILFLFGNLKWVGC